MPEADLNIQMIKPNTTKQERSPILFVSCGMFGFILCEIVFTEHVFNVDFRKISNENYKCEFATELSKYGDIFKGYYPPCLTPNHRPITFNFTNSRSRLREQLLVKDLFDIGCGKYDLDCDLNNVFRGKYENGHCYSSVAPAPQIIIILNDTGVGIPRIDAGLYENDILKGVSSVVWDENNIINGISSGT